MTGFRITPTRPIERNGLKGFGLSVHFGSHSSLAPSQADETKPAAEAPIAVAGTNSTGAA